ncbi:MAG TPA: MlaD family protein [Paracoccus sp. (in: a-proteobacteria)]|uniref:MlaD family protein n=1 Tax=uncultured Paracoccus sp. TaxID=189685 RepID=UPI00261F720F|nr:MlaD family protein [uncultured Paracoccus sp.]HMQ41889.1 MlaD family protein [Paracoccus sp. (in: a-proteobacteria)]HMR37433.1 MlaD family protein [Paracoccus sp. (in: a-proteobacteria)]
METKANFALIGAFTVAGFLGLLGFLMWFAKLQLNQQFAYYDAYFPEVAGLSVSSQVLFAGLNVGTVTAIELAPDSPAAVRVRLELHEHTPVRVDSRASIDTSAVTGVSQVVITPGLPTSTLLRNIETDEIPVIQSSPTALQTIGEQAPELLSRANVVAQRLANLLGDENQERINNILINVEEASGNLNKTMDDVSRATDAVAAAAEDLKGFGDKLDQLSQTADAALTNFGGASAQAETTLASVDTYVNGDLSSLTRDLKDTAAILKDDLGTLGAKAQISLDKLDTALDSATGTMDAAHGVVDEVGPVFTDLRETLGHVNEALANLPEELPRITANIGAAADSAAGAFDSLRVMLDGARTPVRTFTNEGLPQFSRMAQDIRRLVGNIDELVVALKRNPSQIIRGQPTPEFRR